jgi:ureidoglycolate amidohydrolase
MGMIFVPSKSGHSHRSDEYTSPEEIARGVEILTQTMAELSLR